MNCKQQHPNVRRQSGALSTDLIVALGILIAVLLPVSLSIIHEQKLARAYYHQAIAMEIVDGEMEILRAGGWKSFAPGPQPYPVSAEAARNLPAGKFVLTLSAGRAHLEWHAEKKSQGGTVFREARLP